MYRFLKLPLLRPENDDWLHHLSLPVGLLGETQWVILEAWGACLEGTVGDWGLDVGGAYPMLCLQVELSIARLSRGFQAILVDAFCNLH